MGLHYIIIIVVIAVIFLLQIKIYLDSRRRINLLSKIFPDKSQDSFFVSKKEKDYTQILDTKHKIYDELDEIKEKILNHDGEYDLNELNARRYELEREIANKSFDEKQLNSIMLNIIDSINAYLKNNKGSVSDFHLLKDIVDRNCDSEEEAVQSQIPMPLYYGLMGTMAGIIVGVGYLWLSGGLSALLGAESLSGMTDATDGIIALLAGVALAMVCSVIGIILTTRGTSKLKDVKIEVERRKHNFLTWMQAELLPKLSNDMGDVLVNVTKNLSSFNRTFAKNAKDLNTTLSTVKDTTENQAELLNAVNKIKISKVATANIEVYDKLKNCTDEIGRIGEVLRSCNDYLDEVKQLNERLDKTEDRTRLIEQMGEFFMKERSNLQSLQSVLNVTITEVTHSLKEATERFGEASKQQIDELIPHLVEQRQSLQKAINQQDEVLKSRINEISVLAKSVGDVGKTMSMLQESTKEQNKKIGNLVEAIQDLAEQRITGTVTVSHKKMPLWAKILLISGGSIVTLYCLTSLVLFVISLFSK